MAMMTKTRMSLVAILLVVLLLVYPFNVTVAPERNVKVADEDGDPVPGAYVSEFASHGTLDFAHNEGVLYEHKRRSAICPPDHSCERSNSGFKLGFEIRHTWQKWSRCGGRSRSAGLWIHAHPDANA